MRCLTNKYIQGKAFPLMKIKTWEKIMDTWKTSFWIMVVDNILFPILSNKLFKLTHYGLLYYDIISF